MTDHTNTSGLLPRFIVRRADLSPRTMETLSTPDALCEDIYRASDVHRLLSTLLPLIQPFIQYGVKLRAHHIPDTAHIAYRPTEMPGDALTAGDCFNWTSMLPRMNDAPIKTVGMFRRPERPVALLPCPRTGMMSTTSRGKIVTGNGFARHGINTAKMRSEDWMPAPIRYTPETIEEAWKGLNDSTIRSRGLRLSTQTLPDIIPHGLYCYTPLGPCDPPKIGIRTTPCFFVRGQNTDTICLINPEENFRNSTYNMDSCKSCGINEDLDTNI